MFDTAWYDVKIAGLEMHDAVAIMHVELALMDKKHFICRVVMMPVESAFDPGQPDIVVVDTRDQLRTPLC